MLFFTDRMPHKQRFARQLGYRRANGRVPYKTQFGYGGAGYGGYGRKGKYGGYRSHYPYHNPNGMKHTYRTPPQTRRPVDMHARSASVDDWIPARAYSDSTTFTFGLVLLVIIALGVFFGMRRRNNPFIGYR